MSNDFLAKRKAQMEAYRKSRNNKTTLSQKIDIPEGVFIQCEGCGQALYQKELDKNLKVCLHCQFHFRLNSNERIRQLVDHETFVELDPFLASMNPLQMPEYEEKLTAGFEASGCLDAFTGGIAKINNIPIAIGVLNSYFMMGSMGSVVGERITRLIERAIADKTPLILVSSSGGARMQEGLYSLMQMAKTSGALSRFSQAGLFYLSILTHPTTGGVAASFASLGDVIIAEEGALIGFAGPRVIQQTIKQELPQGFQTSAFQLEHGQVDIVVSRKKLTQIVRQLLSLHQGDIKDE